VRELPSGTVTLLFTDIEGSTRLLRELGDGYADALVEHRRVVRAAAAAYGGVEVDKAEEGRGPLGQWELDRAEYATRVLADAEADFEAARAAGRSLLLDEAIEYAVSVDSAL
jgi:class 3 adenylate cyclase